RRLALVRLFQRHLLGAAEVRGALRGCLEDEDVEVRRVAFLLALLTRERLAPALRRRDAELHRQLRELEGDAPSPSAALGSAEVDEENRQPLVEATASRALDTCLRGARGL